METHNNVRTYVFPAPNGDPREVVKDYMLKMAEIEWTPSHDFVTDWKEGGDFNIGLRYQAGTVYRGVPYSRAQGDYDEFTSFLDFSEEVPVFTPNSPYYEEMVGVHCSSSINRSYQQLLDFPFSGSLRPCKARGTMLELVGDLKRPSYDEWYCGDVKALNSKNDIFEAYAKVGTGDILFKKLSTKSGHSRMVSLPAETVRDPETGLIDGENSFITTIEATNEFDQTRNDGVNTTWWIDHKYSFEKLYSTSFIPVTLTLFDSGVKPKDAHLFYEGENTPESVKGGVNGRIFSDFPIIFVRAKIENESGRTVRSALIYILKKNYSVDLGGLNAELSCGTLGSGKYRFSLECGIARGRVELENFEFII